MTRTINQIIKDIALNKSAQDDVKADLAALEGTRAVLDREFMEAADREQIYKSSVKDLGTVSVEESTVPQASGWDDFYKFIKRNNFFHLLERRPSVTGCRELWEQGKQIPGIDKFSKRRVKFVPA